MSLLYKSIRGDILIIISFIQWLTGLLSGTHFNFTFDGGVLNTISGIINFIAWVLPLDTVFILITISFGLMTFRVIVSFLKTLWSIIPIL